MNTQETQDYHRGMEINLTRIEAKDVRAALVAGKNTAADALIDAMDRFLNPPPTPTGGTASTTGK